LSVTKIIRDTVRGAGPGSKLQTGNNHLKSEANIPQKQSCAIATRLASKSDKGNKGEK
jgi:hypothetical protein